MDMPNGWTGGSGFEPSAASREGRAEALTGSEFGQLLESYRAYLNLLVRIEIGRGLQAKVDASDLVQETLLEAHRHLPSFRGGTEAEFTAWLRQIMAGRLANVVRHYYGTQGRDVRLERDLAAHLDQSSQMFEAGLVDAGNSPSQQAAQREQSVLLAAAMQALPADYREVILLRHFQDLPFAEIARTMNRSVDSVEKLWVRGLARLRQVMGGPT
jgi:RNA polymerase sigma-70 factor (ECF subfamily)